MTAPLAVYLVKGDDSALVSQALASVLAEVTAGDDSGLGTEDLSADEPDIGAVIDACLTPPFLADRRTVVVRDLGRLPAAEVDRLVGYLESPSDTTSLVLGSTGAVSARLLNAVKTTGHVVDAAVPGGKGRTSWLVSRLKDAPVRFDAAAGAALGDHLGEELGRLSGIIGAVTAAYGEGASIGVAELEPFLGEAGVTAPWELTDAIDSGDPRAALLALRRLTGSGARHPLVVLATLHRHYSVMARLDGSGVTSDAEAARLLGLRSTFPATKARAQAGRLGHANIVRAMTLVAEADIDLRGRTAIPDEALLEILVARLARLAPRRRAARRR
jgi:DNA polymerase III subunit delta